MRLFVILFLCPLIGACRLHSGPVHGESRRTANGGAEVVRAPDRLSERWWERVRERLVRAAEAEGGRRVDWSFRIRSGNGPNAVSWPGGHVEVTHGLLAFVKDEDELAAVVAHEMVHVLERHGWKRVAAGWVTVLAGAAISWAVAANAGGGEAVAAGGGFVGAVSLSGLFPLSRAHEIQADLGSLRLLTRAGYDPHASLRFWKRYAKWRASQGLADWSAFSAHPPDEVRLDRLRAALRALPATDRRAP